MSLLRGITVVLALTAVAPAALAQFQFAYDADQQTWTLTNGKVTAVFQLSPAGNFGLQRFIDLTSQDAWVAGGRSLTSPILLRVDNVTYDADTPFRLVNQAARSITRRAYRQTILLEDLQRRGQVIVELEMYENQPVLRHRVRFRNTQSSAVRVRWADFLPWSFDDAGGAYRALRVNQWVKSGTLGNFEPLEAAVDPEGQALEIRSGAYAQHCAWLALHDGSARGMFAGWEFDGRSTASIRHFSDSGYLQLSASVDDLSRPLQPGGQFQAPAAFIGLFHGDWDEAAYHTQRFAEAALAPAMPDRRFPYVVWDSWKYQTAIDEVTLRRNADVAARIGVEVFILDLGWARQIGDWHEDPRKFPRGLRALSDYVHDLGMKFGLHFPLAEAMETAPVLRANPDWTSSRSYDYFDALSLCLSHRPVNEWVVSEGVRLIDEYNVDWILQDGENMVKECTKTTHTHDRADSNYSNSVDGLNSVVAAIQAQRPNVHWENCEDGGNMMTFNMVRRYVTSIAADDSGPLTTRQAVYGVTYPFPTRYADRYMPDDQLRHYVTRSYMFGGPWIFMNRLAEMEEEDIELAASEVKLYKSMRLKIRDGKVFHLTPRPAENNNDAMESYDEATDSAIIFVFRNETARNPRIRPRGLNPENTYQVHFQEDRRILTMTGAQLMRGGILMNMNGPWSAEIVYIELLHTP